MQAFFFLWVYKTGLFSPYIGRLNRIGHTIPANHQNLYGGMTMNGKEQKRITELRMKGYGYRRIANLLCMPSNTIKSYCRRHPLEQNPNVTTSSCLQCGVKMHHSDNRYRKFCSDKCRLAWWKAHAEHPQGTDVCVCPVCGQSFDTYKSKNRKFCSRQCYFAARKETQGNGQEI